MWEDSTGYNSLNHTIIISDNAAGETYNGNNFLNCTAVTTDVKIEQAISPQNYSIDVYPNPFNGINNYQISISIQKKLLK